MKTLLGNRSKTKNKHSILLLLMIISFMLWLVGKNLNYPKLTIVAAYLSAGILAFAAGILFEKVAYIEQMVTEIKDRIEK